MGYFTIFDTPPDFVNEVGTKWWKDAHTTAYANKPNAYGVSLDCVCYLIEEHHGYRTRVLVMDNKIIYENQNLEAIAARIDIMKTLKGFNDEQSN